MFARGLLAAALVATAVDSRAQARVSVVPSVEMAHLYDDNVFFSTDDRRSDMILRASPALSLQHESLRWSLSARLGFDAERFSRHAELTTFWARRRSAAGARYRATPRLDLAFDGEHIDTETPMELNVVTGLATARVRARRSAWRPSATYRVSPRTVARVDFEHLVDDLTGGVSLRSRSATAGIERRVSLRDALTLDAELATFAFGREPSNSQMLRIGWIRETTTRTQVKVHAGPRVTDGSPSLDVSASAVTRVGTRTSVALSFDRTRTTAVGYRGIVGTLHAGARLGYEGAAMALSAGPAVYRTTGADLDALVWRLDAGGSFRFTPAFTARVTYAFDRQRGGLHPGRLRDGELSHSVLTITLAAGRHAPSIGPGALGASR